MAQFTMKAGVQAVHDFTLSYIWGLELKSVNKLNSTINNS